MKKIVATIAAAAALLLTGACASESTPTTRTPVQIETPSGPSASQCTALTNKYTSVMNELLAALPYVTTQTEIDSAVEAGRASIDAGRSLIAACGQYSSDNGRAFGSSLDDLETVLDTF